MQNVYSRSNLAMATPLFWQNKSYGKVRVGGKSGMISIRPTGVVKPRGHVKAIDTFASAASSESAVPEAAKALPAGSKSTMTKEMLRMVSSEVLRASAATRGIESKPLTDWLLILISEAGFAAFPHMSEESVS